MPNYQKYIAVGHLTRDPELRALPNGTPVVNIGLAVNHKYKTRDGEQREDVLFIDCESFGKQAEVINQYFEKGKPILIEGRLKLDQWQDQNGNNRSKIKVFIESFSFIGGGGNNAGSGNESSSGPAPDGAPLADDEDIPF